VLNLTLARHASTRHNEESRYQGWIDPPLSARGVREAGCLGEALAGQHFDFVLCSDLQRARATARQVAPAVESRSDARLRELDFGGWDGLTYDEAEARFGERLRRWIERPTRVKPPGGESFRSFRARVTAVYDALPAAGEVLLVAHGGSIRLILAHALGLSWRQVVLMQLSACGITRLAVHPEGAHLLCLNSTAHLARDCP
jgi:broad specificity phosphatase PhoE